MSVVCAKVHKDRMEIAADSALAGDYDRYNKYLDIDKINSFEKDDVQFVVGSVGMGNAISFLKHYFDASDILDNICKAMKTSRARSAAIEKANLSRVVYSEVIRFYKHVTEFTGGNINDREVLDNFICESLLCFFSPKTKKPYVFAIDEFIITPTKKDYAIGSGSVHAQSLLDHDHSIDEAVRAACERSIECYMPIKKFTLYNDGEIEFVEVQ